MGRLATPFSILSTSLKGSQIRPLRGRTWRRNPTSMRSMLETRIYIFQEYEETCLFISHDSLQSESPRVFINILKIPPPFASNEGYTASGTRYRERRRVRQQPTASFLFSRNKREDVLLSARVFFISFCLYSFISSYSLLIITSTVL